jgi:hypothetical protein
MMASAGRFPPPIADCGRTRLVAGNLKTVSTCPTTQVPPAAVHHRAATHERGRVTFGGAFFGSFKFLGSLAWVFFRVISRPRIGGFAAGKCRDISQNGCALKYSSTHDSDPPSAMYIVFASSVPTWIVPAVRPVQAPFVSIFPESVGLALTWIMGCPEACTQYPNTLHNLSAIPTPLSPLHVRVRLQTYFTTGFSTGRNGRGCAPPLCPFPSPRHVFVGVACVVSGGFYPCSCFTVMRNPHPPKEAVEVGMNR